MKVQKLYNGFIYNHPLFEAAFAEYLLQNGFELKETFSQLHFTKGPLKLVVMNDNMDVFQHNPHAEEGKQQWEFSHQLQDFSKMDIAEFIYTMHVSLITPMDKFVDNAYAISEQLGVEARMVMRAAKQSNFFKSKLVAQC